MKLVLQLNTARFTEKSDSYPPRHSVNHKLTVSRFSAVLSENSATPIQKSSPSKASKLDEPLKGISEFLDETGSANSSVNPDEPRSNLVPPTMMEIRDILDADPATVKTAGMVNLQGNRDNPLPNLAPLTIDKRQEATTANAINLDAVVQDSLQSALGAPRFLKLSGNDINLSDCDVAGAPKDLQTRQTQILVNTICSQAIPYSANFSGIQKGSIDQGYKPNGPSSEKNVKGDTLLTAASRRLEKPALAKKERGSDEVDADQQFFGGKSHQCIIREVASNIDAQVTAKTEMAIIMLPTTGDAYVASQPASAHFADFADGTEPFKTAPVMPFTFATQLERHVFNVKANSLNVQLESAVYGTVSARFSGDGERMSVVVYSTDNAASENLIELESELKHWIDVFEPNVKPKNLQPTLQQQEALELSRDNRQGASPTDDFSRQRQDQQSREQVKPEQERWPERQSEVSADQNIERWRKI